LACLGAYSITWTLHTLLALGGIGSFLATLMLAIFAWITVRENAKLIRTNESLASSTKLQVELPQKQEIDRRSKEQMAYLQDTTELVHELGELLEQARWAPNMWYDDAAHPAKVELRRLIHSRCVIAPFDTDLERLWSIMSVAYSSVDVAAFTLRLDGNDENRARFQGALNYLWATLRLVNLHTGARLA
jgi:hypothetical protein